MSGLRRRATTLLLRGLALFAPERPGPQPTFRPRRAVVVRYAGLGDVVSATAVVERLRLDYPDCEIAFVCAPGSAPLLAGQPSLDRVLPEPRPTWRSALSAWRRWRRWGLDRRDLLVLLEIDPLAIALAWAVGARFRLGLDAGGQGFGVSLSHAAPVRAAHDELDPGLARQSVAEVFQRPLFLLTGKPWAPAAPRLELTASERAPAAPGSRRRVCLLPTGTAPDKLWPAERYAALAERLTRRGYEVCILAGPGEIGLQSLFAAAAPSARIEIGTRCLRESLALLAGSALAIGNDTGPLHAAAALGTRTLALFGPTAWWAYARATRDNRVLIPADAPLGLAAYDAARPAVTGIDLDSVERAALALLTAPERLGQPGQPVRAGTLPPAASCAPTAPRR